MKYRICHSSKVTGTNRVLKANIDTFFNFLSTQSAVNNTSQIYQSMPKRGKQKIKSRLPYVLPGELHPGKLYRKLENVKSINLLALDIDNPENTRQINYSELDKYNHIRYHTISSTPDAPRLRILFPVKPGTYPPGRYKSLIQTIQGSLLGGIEIDACSYRVNQPMFLPIYFRDHGDDEHYIPVVAKEGICIDAFLSDVQTPTGQTSTSQPVNQSTSLTEFVKSTNRQPENIEVQNVASLISRIDPSSRETWLKVSLALRHEAGEDQDRQSAFRSLFNTWSSGKLSGINPTSYVGEEDCNKHWYSISPQPEGCQTPTTIGTIRHMVRQTVIGKADSGDITPESVSYQWVYIKASNSFYNLLNGDFTPRSAFDLSMTKVFKTPDNTTKAGNLRTNPSEYLASEGILQTASYMEYAPGEDKIFGRKGITYANLYTPPDTPIDILPTSEASKAPDLFIQHLRTTWPGDYTLLLEWIAYLAQNPASRVIWCPILQGEPGCGKTAVTVVLQNILGIYHVKTTNSAEISSNFNSWAYNRRVTVIEELKLYGKDRHNTAERLKEYVTNRSVSVNEKYAQERNVANTVSYIAYTNHQSPLPVERGDRRYSIMSSPLTSNQVKLKSESGEYDHLFTTLRGSAGSLYQFFRSYVIPASFSPESRAPETEGTQVARQLSKNQLELYTDAVISSTFEGCNILSAHLVHLAINKAFREVYRPNKNDLMRVTEYLMTEYNFTLTGKLFTFFTARMEVLAKHPYGSINKGMKKTIDKFNRFDNMEVLSQFKKEQL